MSAKSEADPGIAFCQHDHGHCQISALDAVRARCERENLRLTPMREKVLKILLREHRAIGAYDLLRMVAAPGKPPQPPIIYRALSFLTENGFAHRIECLGAYIACQNPGAAHHANFLICRKCDKIAEEVENLRGEDAPVPPGGDFRIDRRISEAEGVCPACQKGEA